MSNINNRVIKNKEFNNKKKSMIFYKLLFSGFFVITLLLCLSLPIFNVIDFNIVNVGGIELDIEYLTKDYVGKNIFAINTKDLKTKLEKNPAIKSAKVIRVFPHDLKLEINSRTPKAYLEMKNLGSFILIDSEGFVIAIEGMVKENIPVIEGFDVGEVQVGQVIITDGEKRLKGVLEVSRLLENYEIKGVSRFVLSDDGDVLIRIDKIDIKFGNMKEANEKAARLKEIIIELNKKVDKPRGFIDCSDMNVKPIFKQLK